MPIDIDQSEQGSEDGLRSSGRTNAERILSFLASNPDKAYTPKEIHDATDVARGSVGVVLSRLEDRGLVRHRGDYWAIGDVDDLETSLHAMATARTVTDRFGPEDPDEWGRGVGSELDPDQEGDATSTDRYVTHSLESAERFDSCDRLSVAVESDRTPVIASSMSASETPSASNRSRVLRDTVTRQKQSDRYQDRPLR